MFSPVISLHLFFIIKVYLKIEYLLRFMEIYSNVVNEDL